MFVSAKIIEVFHAQVTLTQHSSIVYHLLTGKQRAKSPSRAVSQSYTACYRNHARIAKISEYWTEFEIIKSILYIPREMHF